ncbi:MAG: YraN family protein [Actinobacteria bacterium]|nr:YraN family protein [Actinomycetota bacterium]
MAHAVDIHGAGRHGEDRAARHYVDRGYAVVARNWRWSGGEIDLVVVRDDQLVIVEVRLRSSDTRGSAAATVGALKRERLRSSAVAFAAAHPEWLTGGYRHLRVDVVTIDRGRLAVIRSALSVDEQ